MSKIAFVEYLNSVIPLSVVFKEELTANLNEEKYTAHQILSAAGQTENRLWFVSEGFARSCNYDTSDKQHTLNFFKENDLIFSRLNLLITNKKRFTVAREALSYKINYSFKLPLLSLR